MNNQKLTANTSSDLFFQAVLSAIALVKPGVGLQKSVTISNFAECFLTKAIGRLNFG